MTGEPAPQHSRPLWLAAFITAILTPVGYFFVLMLVSLVRGEFSAESSFRALGFLFFVVLAPSLGAMYLIGMPLALLLRSQGLLTVPYLMACAIGTGVSTIALLTALIAQDFPVLEVLGWGLVLGALAGIVFCVSAGIRFRSARA